MKIIYITTSMTSDDFNHLLKICHTAPNPSNQNFHHNLIKAFACYFDITVVSSTPINKSILFDKHINLSDAYEDHINYQYLSFNNSKIFRFISLKKSLHSKLKYLSKIYHKDLLLVVDGMNATLAKEAQKFAKKHHIPTLGIVTDNPNLLTDLSPIRTKRMIAALSNFDNYICLNDGLNELFNKHNRPSLIIEGIVNKTNKQQIKGKFPYFFFGGALYEKYGVKNLIHSFQKLDTQNSLYIAGNGPLKDYIIKKSIKDKRIRYLGILSQDEMQAYENGAIANINPRPYTKDFDKYCIPSKLLEYANSSALTISTYHSRLYKIFGSSIYWCKDNETDLLLTLEKVNALDELTKKKKILKANVIANKNFGLNSISEKIRKFIKNIAK